MPALHAPPAPGVPLGLYLHIPFCRKRCHFCYFRVYTDKNSDDVDPVPRHAGCASGSCTPHAGHRRPAARISCTSAAARRRFCPRSQLQGLVNRLKAITPWDAAEEVTFECEPGTLTESKLAVIRDLGVTRLSLGVENFGDEVLELNGRAHRSPEVFRAYEYARALDFPQINIDLIAGMLGETEENWHEVGPEDARACSPTA